MPAFRIFDPYAFLGAEAQAEPAPDDGEHEAQSLAGLATLAAAHGEIENRSSSHRSDVARHGAVCATALVNQSRGVTPAKVAKAANRLVAGLWGLAEEERAANIHHGAGTPHAWREGYARLHPDCPPGDVPLRRWQTFVDDCGRFLDSRWAEKVALLCWGPLDLFGCDRERPFARIDHAGLLWLLNDDKLVELDRKKAVIERRTGARQTFRRRPLAVGEIVLAWELVAERIVE
jgi:hypothetical protein